jgi:hypothetical protein
MEILMRPFVKQINLLKEEKKMYDRESIYHEVIGDLRNLYIPFRELTINEQKVEKGVITGLKERLAVFEKFRLFKD